MTKCQKLSRKAAWFAGRGASVIALLAATGGISQANAQGAESEKTAGIDELVVTAQKRAQSAQDVGITINSYGAEQIEKFGWDAPEDVAGMTPGLFVSPGASGGAAANYSIRGIGLNDFTTNNSSPVAVHIDEVFLPSMNFLNFGLFDLERVEVLKGPQGTLFGRNTTGGTVNFYTRKPTEEFEAGITAGAARHSRADIDAYVSGPVSDTLSYRLSGFFRTQSGGDGFNSFYNREVGGIDEWWSVRGQLAWRPTENFDVNISVFGGVEDQEGNTYGDAFSYDATGYVPGTFGALCSAYANGDVIKNGVVTGCVGFEGVPNDGDFYTNNPGVVNNSRVKSFGTIVTGNLDFSFATLTSVTGYLDVNRFDGEDADFSPPVLLDIFYDLDHQSFSEEIRLTSSETTPLSWTIGTSFATDEVDAVLHAIWPLFGGYFPNIYTQKTDAFAVFGQGEYALTDQLSILAGLRYSIEDRSFLGGTQAHNVPANLAPYEIPPESFVAQLAFADDSVRAEKVNYKVGVNYHLTDSAMLYASYTTGFKGGGFTGTWTFNQNELEGFNEENLKAVEAGFKSQFLDNRVRWNTSFYYYDYEDIILQINENVPQPVFRFQNGADAEVFGVETDLVVAPTAGLQFGVAAAWQDSEIVDVAIGNEALLGQQLVYAPEWSGSWFVDYSFPIGRELESTLSFNGKFSSDYQAEYPPTPVSTLPGYATVDVRLALAPLSGQWEVAAWARNLTDEHWILYLNDIAGCCSQPALINSQRRSFGFEVTYRFGAY